MAICWKKEPFTKRMDCFIFGEPLALTVFVYHLRFSTLENLLKKDQKRACLPVPWTRNTWKHHIESFAKFIHPSNFIYRGCIISPNIKHIGSIDSWIGPTSVMHLMIIQWWQDGMTTHIHILILPVETQNNLKQTVTSYHFKITQNHFKLT